MGHFDNMLGASESLFKNELALDYDFLPKLLPFRENEQKAVANSIKPLFGGHGGRNLIVSGAPGIGKTAAIRHIFRELEEKTDEIVPIHLNCWQRNTSYKVFVEICNALGYKFTQNKKTDELFNVIKQILNKQSVVFAFDEVDKVEDFDFLYSILEEIYRKSIILITNYKEWILNIDERIKSRLMAEHLEFKQYNQTETREILKQRCSYAFVEGAIEQDAIAEAASKTSQIADIRTGLYILREAGRIAEEDSSRKVTKDHVEKAIAKIDDFSIKNKDELDDDSKFLLEVIKKNSGKKIGDIFKIYQKDGGEAQYKTVQRKIRKLQENKFITTKKIIGGSEGSTTIVNYEKSKKLSEWR